MPETLRDKLAFAMYLTDHEAEHLPFGPDQDLDILAQRWDSMRVNNECHVRNYYRLADRMIAHWDQHADRETIDRCLATRRQHERDAGVEGKAQ